MNPRIARPKILLCVTGSVAAYKSASLARRLSRSSEVRVLMTPAATRLVRPSAFRAASGVTPRTGLFDGVSPLSPLLPAGTHPRLPVPHIDFARNCDLVLVAPASADFLAKLARGLADDLPSTACLYASAPLWVAPAMNEAMWRHPAVRENVRILEGRQAVFLGPSAGPLACGDEGLGRMMETDEIAGRVEDYLLNRKIWRGRTVLVSAGPTREPLDPVRFLSNRSSGRMGYAVAEAARRRGARVVLVSGPTSLPPPAGVRIVRVETALEMRRAVLKAFLRCDLAVLAAAVADWRPARASARKIKKGKRTPPLSLTPNPDILAEVLRLKRRQLVVGFAAETHRLDAHARAKWGRKPCDVLAANLVGKGMGMETADNRLRLYVRGLKKPVELGRGPKEKLAEELLDCLDRQFGLGRKP
jgi:phosphopantothenoylcysteine decarboxylase / phosphopantothenate---cysteine ligase